MSASRAAMIVGLLVVTSCAAPGQEQRMFVGLGQPMTQADLAFWDTSILTDGSNLPPGSGSSSEGLKIYAQKCAACHGPTGAESNTGMTPLVGGIGTLASDRPLKTLGSYWPYSTIVFDYVRRAMPYDSPKSLSDSEVYALTAYLLHANGIIGEADVLDRANLPAVRMPNRDGFVRTLPKLPLQGRQP